MSLMQLKKTWIVSALAFLCLAGGCGVFKKNSEMTQPPQSLLQKETEWEPAKLSKEDLLARFSKQIPSCNLDRFEGREAKRNETSRKPISLSEEQSHRVIVKNKNTLIACYERAMKNGKVSDEVDLHLKFEITVNRKGLVTDVDISGNNEMDENLRRCLERRVQNWTFPRSQGKSMLSFPFMFARG